MLAFYEKALIYYEKCLILLNKNTSVKDRTQYTANIYTNLAYVYKHQQKYKQAYILLDQALKMLGENKPQCLNVLLNLAIIHDETK